MSTKNVYLYKVVILDTKTNKEVPTSLYKNLFNGIFMNYKKNGALRLDTQNSEPIMMDILEDNPEYLFACLGRKRPNNSMQKRNYNTYVTTEVLTPTEKESSGVELFTYCILGYKHGILSIVSSKGAPSEGALARVFTCYNHRFSLETQGIPNQNLINELLSGKAPEINKVEIDIAQPNAEILQKLFGFNDKELLQEMGRNMSSLVFEVKPNFRGKLLSDPNIIGRLVGALKQGKKNYNSVLVSGKKDTGERQRQYDLYEEFFKYPIPVNEYQQENGRRVERDKKEIQKDIRLNMMNIYDEYKKIILAVSNR